MMRNSAEIFALVFLITAVTSSWGQSCDVQRRVSSAILSPLPFFGSSSIFPGSNGCAVTTQVNDVNAVMCNSESLLFDNDTGPETFDLDESNTLNRFVGWNIESYVMFDMGAVTTITAIDMSVVNLPSRSLGLPNIQIYSSETVALKPTDFRVTVILYDYLQNEHLSSSDRTVRNITLRPRMEVSIRYLLLRWTFTGLAIENFALSEIRFCGDNQPNNFPQRIRFLTPTNVTTAIQPSARDIEKRRPLILRCTVANSGSFTWQWTRNGQPISRSSNFEIVGADGTRTTTLTILNFSARDINVEYFCQVSTNRQSNIEAARQFITLPFTLTVREIRDQRPIMVTCEAYGYVQDIDYLIRWLVDGIEVSSEYDIGDRVGPGTLISFNGRSRPSIISTLEIPKLSSVRRGLYTCQFGESAQSILVMLSSKTPASTVAASLAPRQPTPTSTPAGFTAAKTMPANMITSEAITDHAVSLILSVCVSTMARVAVIFIV